MNAKKWWVIGSIVISICSIGALYYIVAYIWPVPETSLARPQLLFLLFMFLSLGAGSVPITAYLNQRFAKSGWFERDRSRLVRQGIWFGLFGILLAYLQLIRALTWTIVIVLAGVFVLIEMFFITRE
jgi:hypothetical protein